MIDDYINDLLNEDSSIEPEKFRQLVCDSVKYMVLQRCGLDTSSYIDSDIFSSLNEFSNPDVIDILGESISNISEQALRKVEQTVKTIERRNQNERNNAQNKMIDGVEHLLCESNMTYYPTTTVDKTTGLSYTLDPETFIYLPALSVEEDTRDVGRWGRLRHKYLRENKRRILTKLIDTHKLTDHLIEVNEAAEKQMEQLEAEMMEAEGVTEELKATDQMKWVQMMNSINLRAEEIVLNNLIYA